MVVKACLTPVKLCEISSKSSQAVSTEKVASILLRKEATCSRTMSMRVARAISKVVLIVNLMMTYHLLVKTI